MSNTVSPEPNPEIVANNGLSLVTPASPENDAPLYPVYEFNLSPTKMIDGPVLPVGTADRVRGTLTALVESGAPVDDRTVSANFRKRQQNTVSTFMKKKFTHRGSEYVYKNILDVSGTEKSLLFALMVDRDPVAQVLSIVAAEYGEAIGEREFGNVVHGVLTTTHWQVLEPYYRQRVEDFRKQLA